MENFSVKDKATGRRAWRCRACVAENSREHYQRNQLIDLARARQNKRAYRHRNRSLVIEFMRGQHCIDCGESDPIVLEFDHRDGVEKEDSVARLMATGSWSTIADEIAKCEIRCANCHRRRTAEQFSWLKRSLQIAAAKIEVTRE